jgi:hypothetical protein
MVNELYQSKEVVQDDQLRLRTVATLLADIRSRAPEKLADFEERLLLHFQLSESLKIDGNERLETRQSRVFVLLISPFIIIGLAVLYVPYRLSWWISKRLSKKFSQYSSYAFSVGFFLFPLWYLFLGSLTWWLSERFSIGCATIFVLVGTGYFTSKYFNRFALYIFAMLWPGKKTPVDVLRVMRDRLFDELQRMHKGEDSSPD